jgi:hypothetical protein
MCRPSARDSGSLRIQRRAIAIDVSGIGNAKQNSGMMRKNRPPSSDADANAGRDQCDGACELVDSIDEIEGVRHSNEPREGDRRREPS